MLVSTRSRYGLRAMVEMVREGWDEPVSLARLAENEEVSQRYLEQIFLRLREAGLVAGRRGPRGGYVLAKDPSTITLLEIITTLETGFLAPECAEDAPNCSGRGARDRIPCHRQDGCATRILWRELRRCCFDYLENRSLFDLAMNRNSSEGSLETVSPGTRAQGITPRGAARSEGGV
jgi:Rrf2 family protein